MRIYEFVCPSHKDITCEQYDTLEPPKCPKCLQPMVRKFTPPNLSSQAVPTRNQ